MAPVIPLLPTTIRSASDLLGDVEDRVGGIALARVGLGLDALLLGLADRAVERHVDVLPRADAVLDVSRHLALLLAQAARGNRLEGGHEVELAPDSLASSIAWRTASVAVSEPSVPTTMRLNNPSPFV